MDLVLVTKTKEESFKPSEFMVPVQRQQQIGVTYAEVRRRPIKFDIRSVGMLEADQTRVFSSVPLAWTATLSSCRSPRPANASAVGQPLMTIYSPDLRGPEQELANLLKVQVPGSVSPAPRWIS